MRTTSLMLRNLACKVVHSTGFRLEVNLSPEGLRDLIRERAAGYGIIGGDCVEVLRDPSQTGSAYIMSYAHPDTREHLLTIVEKIEEEVLNAKRQNDLLGMIVD